MGLGQRPVSSKTDEGQAAYNKGNARRLGHGGAIQREGGIEGRRCRAANNVRAHPQPVGIEIGIPGPRLQVGIEWCRPSSTDRPRRR